MNVCFSINCLCSQFAPTLKPFYTHFSNHASRLTKALQQFGIWMLSVCPSVISYLVTKTTTIQFIHAFNHCLIRTIVLSTIHLSKKTLCDSTFFDDSFCHYQLSKVSLDTRNRCSHCIILNNLKSDLFWYPLTTLNETNSYEEQEYRMK